MLKNLIRFSLPFLISSFLQTFYGLADLFFVGRWGGADTITAVSVGSQITHMLTVVIVGLSMGTTVAVGHLAGAGNRARAAKVMGNTVTLFTLSAFVLTGILILCLDGIIAAVATPAEAVEQAKEYLLVCFIGIPFITAYNVISSIFRGLGDSRTPMYFVAAAGVVNIVLDYILIGPFAMEARGAAIATVAAQGCSVVLGLTAILGRKEGVRLTAQDFRPEKDTLLAILRVGIPIAVQDGFIQISFLVITAIANSRGVDVAAAVGIVEKLIGFFFLVPSAMLSSVSAIASQNAGAGKHGQAKKVLRYGVRLSVCFGMMVAVVCQFCAETLVGLFAEDVEEVVRLGAQYLRAYVFDCGVAGIHFCFSGYFCAYGKSVLSFIHNVASVLLVRIPGAYLASRYFPESLYPMGWAAPAGSLLSVVICVGFYAVVSRRSDSAERRYRHV
ncbi:MAG: MATE family efflux transporter [Acetatifactor muris]|nr:MATE family efflux transporter [Acetatifactor muris]